ncbi:MAG: poly-beta-1,6-N-acetyl-D-glucosamine biosynthesis protein PgaD [Myxococcota bacterium]
MQDSLIINVRDQLGWSRRFASDLSTLALWGAWLWLCRPVVVAIAILFGSHAARQVKAAGFGALCPTYTLESGGLLLLGTASALLLWNRLTASHVTPPRLTGRPDYAGHFGLSQAELERGLASAICVLHHDEQGRIVALEADPDRPKLAA